ncbi:quercetin dioxygenase-like cupin family protein [Actinoplanes octamycinicus]|uniref:Quercetin dioxygenase-like cupin family protein n=1 Tax=Actinoplanes octamycinicus TaxID=135948 RepID=A0A7W7H629_9ACTN|nr:cupin domain-containing protein [Actinoplanes octamycinicus]MBB4744509.1 quercetin dioxygenase-like cupin family protein [Actinoplanes octamycinicus]GIE61572.1 hypothetical protein Aoc01nite_69740 [Actinoplanes octamycinicus]
MEIVRPEPETLRQISHHGSVGLTAQALLRTGSVAMTVLRVAPGGEIGDHPALRDQTLLITEGAGQVRSGDGPWHDVIAGDAVRWAAGESHTTRSAPGLTAVAVEVA